MSLRDDAAGARLFVALWPPPAARRCLAGYRDRWHWPPAARVVADRHLHATLHFIGTFAVERVAALGEQLGRVPVRNLTLHAQGAAIWRGGVAVLTLQGDCALDALHEELGAALEAVGVALDARPFAPHVTLARKAAHAQAPVDLPDLDWCATGFVLAESLRGPPARYEVLTVWGAPGLPLPP